LGRPKSTRVAVPIEEEEEEEEEEKFSFYFHTIGPGNFVHCSPTLHVKTLI